MNILIIGKDTTIFELGVHVFGDTQTRHKNYAGLLQEACGINSNIRIISYTTKEAKYQIKQLENGLTLYPTSSLHRAIFLIDLIRLLPIVLDNWKPDVITVQTPWEEGILGYFISRIVGAQFLPQLHFDLFSESWCQEHWLNRWRRWVATQIICHADGVRVVSEVLKNKVINCLNISAEKIFVVPVGVNFTSVVFPIDKEYYKSKLNQQLAFKPTVLFVGRFCHQKNLPLWIEVASKVTERIPDVQFILAGDGSLMPEIINLIKQKGLQEQFHLLGKVGYECLPEVYAAADTFLLTSDYEGYGRVIVESLLSEVPVVSTSCTGPEDLIIDGVNGFLLPPDDLTGLSDAVVKLLQDKHKAKCMGKTGRERMMTMFSHTDLTQRLIECWLALKQLAVEV